LVVVLPIVFGIAACVIANDAGERTGRVVITGLVVTFGVWELTKAAGMVAYRCEFGEAPAVIALAVARQVALGGAFIAIAFGLWPGLVAVALFLLVAVTVPRVARRLRVSDASGV
jgi:hypothetical protein